MSKTNRRRFNDDQVQSLETTFETESRPELRLKQHLANKLGLQPRQIAIWFQNKRARSKSKQIERDYTMLKSNYDQLASEFEALMKENQALLTQVQRLRKMADKSDGGDENRMLCIPSDANVVGTAEIGEGSLPSPEKGCGFECCTFLDNSGTTSTSSQWWDFSSLEI